MDRKEARKLKRSDSYGFKKLLVEQEIFEWQNQLEGPSKPKVLSLRLADVIGPWDDSCRFWKYMLWLEIAEMTGSREYKVHLDTKDHIN